MAGKTHYQIMVLFSQLLAGENIVLAIMPKQITWYKDKFKSITNYSIKLSPVDEKSVGLYRVDLILE